MYATKTTPSSAKLSQEDLARLNDAALEVILRHGVNRPSVDVELELWDALNRAHRREHRAARWLRLVGTPGPSRQEMLSALASAAYGVAIESGARGELLELDLLFSFQVVEPVRKAPSTPSHSGERGSQKQGRFSDSL